MKKKDYHRIEDFLEDASFIAWVHEADTEAGRFWRNWQMEHPEQAEMLETARAIVKGLKFEPKYVEMTEVHGEWEKLTSRIDQREESKISHIQAKRQWLNYRKTMWVAAAVALLITIGFLLQQYSGPEVVSYHADFGKRQEISLPDGTQLTLNANSTLQYEKGEARKVWLEGEAFFKVAKGFENRKKFQVITSDLVVEVYGTEFNVNSRKRQTQVVLEEGKVKLALSNGTFKEMQAGDLITYSANQNQIIEEKQLERVTALTSWKDGTLIFEDISLKNAMEKIAELYGLEVVFEQAEMAEEKIHLAVPTDNLEICILAMKRSGSIRINLEDKTLTVSR